MLCRRSCRERGRRRAPIDDRRCAVCLRRAEWSRSTASFADAARDGRDGRQQNLGRWDFGPSEVRAATNALPANRRCGSSSNCRPTRQLTNATQLWLRLVPTKGAKLLAHAKIDLTQPGVFSSNSNKIWPTEESVVAASYEEAIASGESIEPIAPRDGIAATMNEATWAVAAPGKPANLPAESQDETVAAVGEPRAEPIPAAIAMNTAMPPVPKVERRHRDAAKHQWPKRRHDTRLGGRRSAANHRRNESALDRVGRRRGR